MGDTPSTVMTTRAPAVLKMLWVAASSGQDKVRQLHRSINGCNRKRKSYHHLKVKSYLNLISSRSEVSCADGEEQGGNQIGTRLSAPNRGTIVAIRSHQIRVRSSYQ